MVSIVAHVGIGILFAELVLRLRIKDKDERSLKRVTYWSMGLIAGLIPDLDVIPAIILGVHSYTFHHIFTHTFLALGVVAIICFGFLRKNEYATPFFFGYGLHLFADYIDNSIAPLGPFDATTELGLLPGWGQIPGGSWASEYWLYPSLYPGTENHTLWSMFMNNGWGIPIGIEFLSIYDLVLIVITIILFVIWIKLIIQKRRRKSGGSDVSPSLGLFLYFKTPNLIPIRTYQK